MMCYSEEGGGQNFLFGFAWFTDGRLPDLRVVRTLGPLASYEPPSGYVIKNIKSDVFFWDWVYSRVVLLSKP